MSELIVTLLRIGFLALLWVFVLAALNVLRKDLFGTRVTARGPGRTRQRAAHQPARPARTAPTRLVVTAGPLAGTTIPLGPSAVLVGRAPGSTLVLDDDYSSSRHARFFPQQDGWWVEDLGSTNGTIVNEQPISGPVQISSGTPVRVGQTVMELRR